MLKIDNWPYGAVILPFWVCTIFLQSTYMSTIYFYIQPIFLAANFRKCRCCRLCCSKSWTTMKQSIFVTLMMLNACGFIDSSKIFPILKIFLRNRVGINQCLIWLLIYWSRQARDSKSCTSMLGLQAARRTEAEGAANQILKNSECNYFALNITIFD